MFKTSEVTEILYMAVVTMATSMSVATYCIDPDLWASYQDMLLFVFVFIVTIFVSFLTNYFYLAIVCQRVKLNLVHLSTIKTYLHLNYCMCRVVVTHSDHWRHVILIVSLEASSSSTLMKLLVINAHLYNFNNNIKHLIALQTVWCINCVLKDQMSHWKQISL